MKIKFNDHFYETRLSNFLNVFFFLFVYDLRCLAFLVFTFAKFFFFFCLLCSILNITCLSRFSILLYFWRNWLLVLNIGSCNGAGNRLSRHKFFLCALLQPYLLCTCFSHSCSFGNMTTIMTSVCSSPTSRMFRCHNVLTNDSPTCSYVITLWRFNLSVDGLCLPGVRVCLHWWVIFFKKDEGHKCGTVNTNLRWSCFVYLYGCSLSFRVEERVHFNMV